MSLTPGEKIPPPPPVGEIGEDTEGGKVGVNGKNRFLDAMSVVVVE